MNTKLDVVLKNHKRFLKVVHQLQHGSLYVFSIDFIQSGCVCSVAVNGAANNIGPQNNIGPPAAIAFAQIRLEVYESISLFYG